MHKLCIYNNPADRGWICQDLTYKNNSTAHSTLNGLVNDRFANYASFLANKYDRNLATERMNKIKGYLKNQFKYFTVVWIDFPGNLKTGEVIDSEIHPLHPSNNLLFKI